jgi:predicted CxxxxCH...CXXCH cytochrome family protein
MQQLLMNQHKPTGHRRQIAAAAALIALTLAACSELRDDVSRPSGPSASVHPAGWLNISAKGSFHGDAIKAQSWDLAPCAACHGADYAGGIAESSCLTCHPGTPEGCSVCHGSARNSAPPEDTSGNGEPTADGVGAHQAHLQEGRSGRAFACATCHVVPDQFGAEEHLDGDGVAEIVWHDAAIFGSASPQYSSETSTCSGTYCHSGGRFGIGEPVVWNSGDASAGACGSCHTLPPATDTGHPAVPEGLACVVCHRTVVDADLRIIDLDLHINGQAEATCASCHSLPPGPETGHPENSNCTLCHRKVIDETLQFIDESLHGNGQVDF